MESKVMESKHEVPPAMELASLLTLIGYVVNMKFEGNKKELGNHYRCTNVNLPKCCNFREFSLSDKMTQKSIDTLIDAMATDMLDNILPIMDTKKFSVSVLASFIDTAAKTPERKQTAIENSFANVILANDIANLDSKRTIPPIEIL